MKTASRLLGFWVLTVFCSGCSDPKASKRRVGPNDTPVARVLKLTGTGSAQASRGTEPPRPLESGSQLFADDILTTDGDVVVEIHLFKNKAQLMVSKAQNRKLSETAAWQAEKGEGKKPLFIDRENQDRTPNTDPPKPPPEAAPPGSTPSQNPIVNPKGKAPPKAPPSGKKT
jgi:hypothetical protein